ncbi:transposase [Corynebacterium matruchotii]|uniref:transposase n=1 Tax=Corynebacterium matruchotii TaxID=43768 RepID=UPI00242AF7DB|nr:transposase [Corynebacterium matruchotii]
MLYLQENIRQQTLANIFGTSQPTISRAINNVLNILNVVLPPPPQPGDLNPNRLYVLDGTLVPCWWWKNARNLYSGKHHKAGHNLQVLTDQAGQIFYISEPLPGSTHDITAIRNTGLFDHMQPWHCTADKGYVGLGCNTPFKRRPGKPLLEWQKRFNKGINTIRYVVERSIAHLKTWRILSTPCRLPRNTTIRAINVIRRIMFYQPPAEPHFPSS